MGMRSLIILEIKMFLNVLYQYYGTGLPNKRVFGSYRLYNTPTCETTSFTQILTSVSGIFGSYRVYIDVWNNVIYEDPNVGKGDLRILSGVQHTDVWNNVIYIDPNVEKGVFGSYRVYNTPTCETTPVTHHTM